jgi:hypothetical protein
LDESLNKARIKLQCLSDEKYLEHKIYNLPKVEINLGNNSTLLRLCMRNKFPREIETVMTNTKSNKLREFLHSCSSAPKFFYKTEE